jgi:hypothetical protein
MDLVTQSILLMSYGAIAFVIFCVILFKVLPRTLSTRMRGYPRHSYLFVIVGFAGLALFVSSIVTLPAGLFMIQLG